MFNWKPRYDAPTVKPTQFHFGLGVSSNPDAVPNTPYLTVNGKVGIGSDVHIMQQYVPNAPQLTVRANASFGYDLTPAGPVTVDYASGAPTLAVSDRVGIGYRLLGPPGTTYAHHAPALAVKGKVGIGFELMNSSYLLSAPDVAVAPAKTVSIGYELTGPLALYPVTPPTLAVKGKVGIGFDWPSTAGSLQYSPNAPGLALAPHRKMSIGYDMVNHGYPQDAADLKVKGSTSVFGTMEVIRNDPAHASPAKKPVVDDPDAKYPIFTAVNGPICQIELKPGYPNSALPNPFTNPAKSIKDAIDDAIVGGRYILLGNLAPLHAEPQQPSPNPRAEEAVENPLPDVEEDNKRRTYGLQMRYDNWYAMLNLVYVQAHKPKATHIDASVPKKKKNKKPPKKVDKSEAQIPARRDVVLAWGSDLNDGVNEPDDAKRNYLRLRYVTDTPIDVLRLDLGHRPWTKAEIDKLKEKETYEQIKGTRKHSHEATQSSVWKMLDDPGEELGDKPSSDHDMELNEEDKKNQKNYRDLVVIDPDGSVLVNGAIYSYRTAKISDGRLKEAITPIDDAMVKIMALRGVSYSWRTGSSPQEDELADREYGLIAQEVESICPEAVSRNDDEVLAVDYEQLTPILIEALKEQQCTINAQRERLERVEQALESVLGGASKAPPGSRKSSAPVTAGRPKKSPDRERSPAARSAAPRADRAARGRRR